MNHTIIISDVIDLININGQQYELDEYVDASGISKQDLIDTAKEVTENSAFEQPDYPKNGYEDFEDEIYNHGQY